MAGIAIDIDRGQLAELCRRHHVRRLALFGSVLRPDFRPDSDVDVLVEFAPGHTPGFAFFGIQEELSELMGRRVELHTPGFLSPYFRDRPHARCGSQDTRFHQRTVPQRSRHRRAAHPEIPWRDIAGTRDRLIHGYFDVDLDVVWSIATGDLPGLVASLEAILEPEG